MVGACKENGNVGSRELQNSDTFTFEVSQEYVRQSISMLTTVKDSKKKHRFFASGHPSAVLYSY